MFRHIHNQISERIHNANNILILPDERLDGDSLGASVAMFEYLRSIGKKTKVLATSEAPQLYKFMSGIDVVSTDLNILSDSEIDLVLVFDCSDGVYVNGLVSKIPSSPNVINIDHHATNGKYGQINLVVESASAACEVTYDLLKNINAVITPNMATLLLTGLCFDTTFFSNQGTTYKSLSVGSELVGLGANLKMINDNLRRDRPLPVLKIWGIALERIRWHSEIDLAVTYITEEDVRANGAENLDIGGISDQLNLLIAVNTLVVLREEMGDIKISMRTNTGDVSAIAKFCGGGGHKKAAGFTLQNTKISDLTLD